MRARPENPPENVLAKGIEQEALVDAIAVSGYPLQSVVAFTLVSGDFGVAEEWDYIDADTQETRNIDVFAFRKLPHTVPKSTPQNELALSLLIECKRSRHPYVFFRRVVGTAIPFFPAITGMPREIVTILERTANGRQTRSLEVSPAQALGLNDLQFLSAGPPVCATMARATVNGKKVELSGDDIFNDLILPLTKALRHLHTLLVPSESTPARPGMVLCVAVLDAPMLLVESPGTASDPVLCPWVRVVRREASAKKPTWSHSRFYAVDVVHAAYFSTFVQSQVMPFADGFAKRIAACPWIFDGRGAVKSLDNWSWRDVGKA